MTAPTPAPASIVLADDDPDTRFICGTLLRARGHHVVEARDGEECVALADGAGVELVALDLRMPRLDGFAAALRLRTDPATWHLPLLAVTALADAASRARALECGVDDVLVKPIGARDFLAGVETLVAAGRRAREHGTSLRTVSAALRRRAVARRRTSQALLERGQAVVERIEWWVAAGMHPEHRLLAMELVGVCRHCGRLGDRHGAWHEAVDEVHALLAARRRVPPGVCPACAPQGSTEYADAC